MIGRVKIIKAEGYGFIRCDNEDFFFHCSQYKGDFKQLALVSPPNTELGPEVQFKAIDSPKGPRAMNVELVQL